MILELWILFCIISLGLFVAGIFYAKFFEKITLLAMSMIFFIPTAFYAFNIEKVGFGSEAVITTTFNYFTIGVFFSFMILLNLGLLIFFSLTGGVEEVQKYM